MRDGQDAPPATDLGAMVVMSMTNASASLRCGKAIVERSGVGAGRCSHRDVHARPGEAVTAAVRGVGSRCSCDGTPGRWQAVSAGTFERRWFVVSAARGVARRERRPEERGCVARACCPAEEPAQAASGRSPDEG